MRKPDSLQLCILDYCVWLPYSDAGRTQDDGWFAFRRSSCLACGDKLMLVMGSRSSQIKPLHPSPNLPYPGRFASAKVIRRLSSEMAFKKAGHRLQVVEDSAGVDDALKAGKYD